MNGKFDSENIDRDQEKAQENEMEAEYNAQNNQDVQGGEQENKEVAQEKEAADALQEENTCQEGEDGGEAEEPACQADQESTVSSQESCASYAPPKYVPNFTVVTESSNSQDTRAQSKDRKNKNGLLVVCAAAVALALLLGVVAGSLAMKLVALRTGNGSIDVLRSDREITVNELPGNTGYTNLSVAQVAALVGECVVEISTTQIQTSTIYGQYITSGAGSGVIFAQSGNVGYIVTNYHVLSGARDITVRIKDGEGYVEREAYFLAGDAAEDIAVVTVTVDDGYELTTAVFGDSDKSVVGEEVVAIGNPLGQLGGTVTDGIISALDREIVVDNNVMTLLQTNAAINPGNSGGGLFNMAGELIGIVNAKQSSAGIEGLGFAIPSNVVLSDINDILELGYISGRVTFGIEVVYGQSNGQTGVYVAKTNNTLLQYKDRIVKINDSTVSTLSDYNAILKKLTVGEQVNIQVVRNGRFENVTVTARENTSAQ